MTKREHTFCLIFSIGEEGLFNGKVGPGWFGPGQGGTCPWSQVHKAPAENFWCILRARY